MGLALVERDDELHVVTDGPEARLCEAMGLLNAATAEVVASIAAALAGGDWQGDGIVTPEHWVHQPAAPHPALGGAACARPRPGARRGAAGRRGGQPRLGGRRHAGAP